MKKKEEGMAGGTAKQKYRKRERRKGRKLRDENSRGKIKDKCR